VRRLLGRSEAVTLIVGHELAIRYLVESAAGVDEIGHSEIRIENAKPYVFDEAALPKAAAWLGTLASSPPVDDVRTDGAGPSPVAAPR